MATTVYGNIIKGYWRTYIYYYVSAETETSITYTCYWGINWVKQIYGNADDDGNYQTQYDRPTYISGTSKKNGYPTFRLTKNWYNNGNRSAAYDHTTFTYTKGKTKTTATVTGYISHNSKSTRYKGASTAKATLTVPARKAFTISFDPNASGDTVTQMPDSITKYYGINEKLPPHQPSLVFASGLGENISAVSTYENAPLRDGWVWRSWNTLSDGSGTDYFPDSYYSGNANATLYAQWSAVDPPTCDVPTLTLSINGTPQTSGDILRRFTTVECHIDNIDVKHPEESRQLDYIKLQIGSEVATMDENNDISLSGFNTKDGDGNYVDPDGEYDVILLTKDDAGAYGTYIIGKINIATPKWSKDIEVSNIDLPPENKDGNAVMVYAGVWNYTTERYDTMVDITPVLGENKWTFYYEFDEDHVSNKSSLNPSVDIVISYRHYNEFVPVANSAFFTTSRNQNYSNGIYNVMFVGGVDNTEYPDYSSRVWWSKINNPLYFPDTNYIEVGSNDTYVQGLTKVGDYLAVIKQSKTTDTAIFLLFPTSFEEETTFAVKQGVQGVGALSKYSFNILGDETLFLSPKGVMAIVPSQDEEHKVQNRSYFVDKRLLAETGIENAYSFVFDGKYFLAIGNGHVYVLDGNQRNSWGNDRTVLVYECYFLDNVPANCFAKFGGNLVFSNQDDVCEFGDTFTDAYDADAETKDAVPVHAEWSTILDDDGSLNYYKTMQKKGNLVSILPMENEASYKQVAVDEETFNEDKGFYFTFDGEKYIQCTDESVYSETESYYIENRSNTKVLVKKDGEDEVEIKRKFGLTSGIPSELFLNKKFKKYKRLQFILRNDADEDFGVDEIVKNYTVGNYAKK